ncbi:hypothetical protein FGG08_003477 [Glutinoglossum americanum]|uniref:methylated diphthine methylhydrolase n=1 Tax=Glutinoglossum americanum TaxID=1670608 RepID=A0A9P8L3M0_9PEZI|nr:hypothetical protein FGG08_003477 [Glutinoglossum americanum]
MDSPRRIKSAFSTVLDQPPSCIEFSPVATEFFVVGTYCLEEQPERDGGAGDECSRTDEETHAPQSRSGCLALFNIADDGLQAIKTQVLPTPYAVLDLHFSPHSPATFAIATSTGAVSLYTLNASIPSPAIAHRHTSKFFSPSILVLALAFHPSDPSLIAVSLSTGSLALTNPSTNSVLHTLPAHALEAWTLAFSSVAENLYSGGDDCSLTRYHLGPGGQDLPTKLWSDRRSHTAGVTAILPFPLDEQILLTGSYDEFVRIYDCGNRRVLAEKKVAEGGGVWRLRLISSYGTDRSRCLVLASCMHTGTRLLEVVREGGQKRVWEIRVLGAFEEHQSMNYASDGKCDGGGRGLVVVSTSFYDRLLCLWRFEP